MILRHDQYEVAKLRFADKKEVEKIIVRRNFMEAMDLADYYETKCYYLKIDRVIACVVLGLSWIAWIVELV